MKKGLLISLIFGFCVLYFLSCAADAAKNEETDKDDSSTPSSAVVSDVFTLEELSSSLAITGVKKEAFSLEEIVIPSHIEDRPVSIIRKNALKGCEKLKRIFLKSDVNIESLMLEPYSFSSLPNLETCTFSENYTASCIPNGEKLSLGEIFSSCPKLNKIIFENISEQELEEISSSYPLGVEIRCNSDDSTANYRFGYVFSSADAVQIISLYLTGDAGTEYEVIEIPQTIFAKNVTSIADNTFSNQKNIKSIKLPETITSIGKQAFDNCEGLEKIICHKSIKSLNYTFPDTVEVEYYLQESEGGQQGSDEDVINAICFESDSPFTIQFNCENCDGSLFYSPQYESDSWTKWSGDNTASTLSSDGKYRIYLRGEGNTRISNEDITLSSSFYIDGEDVSCYGNIMALLEWKDPKNVVMAPYAFSRVFASSPIISAPSLPTDVLSEGCYSFMFDDCKKLKTAPDLPATDLAASCYYCMFQGCSSIKSAPALPATELKEYCYYSMFCNCGSLYDLPSLPSNVMKPYCYAKMFKDCHYNETELTAPSLPATTLAEGCYESMFRDSDFKILPSVLPATVLQKDCYKLMFGACLAETPPSIMATTLAEGCCEGMFMYCFRLDKVPLLRSDELKPRCYKSMFESTNIKVSQDRSSEYTNQYSLGTYDVSSSDALDKMFSANGSFSGTPSSGQILWTSAQIIE